MAQNTKRGFVSRKQAGFLFGGGWKTEWWEVDANSFQGFSSPDHDDATPLLQVKPKRAWKVVKGSGKNEFHVHWREGGSITFKSIEGEEDRDVWMQCIQAFISSAQDDQEDALDEQNASKLRKSRSPAANHNASAAALLPRSGASTPKREDFDMAALMAGGGGGEEEDKMRLSKGGSFSSLLGIIRPARLDMSDEYVRAASSATLASSPKGNNRISPSALNNMPRLASSRDILENQIFMGKASNFAQKIASDVGRSNARKAEGGGGNSSGILDVKPGSGMLEMGSGVIEVTDGGSSGLLELNFGGKLDAAPQQQQQQLQYAIPSQLEEKVEAARFVKTEEQNALLLTAISTELWSLLGQDVTKIAPAQTLVDLMHSVTVGADTTMAVQGGQMDKLYVIENGRAGVYSMDFVDKPRGELEYLKKRGDCFFVHSLLYHQPAPFTITTHVECTMWVLSLKQFNDFMTLQTKKVVVRKLKLLENVQLLADNLSFETIVELADCLEFQEFQAGETILPEGEFLNKLYVLDEGEVVLSNGGQETACKDRGEVFGEWALLANVRSKATIKAKSRTVSMLVLDIEELEELIGPLRKYVLQNMRLHTIAEEIKLAEFIPMQDESMFKFSFGSSPNENKIIQLATLATMNRFAKRMGAKAMASEETALPMPAAAVVAAASAEDEEAQAKPKIFGRKSMLPSAAAALGTSGNRVALQLAEQGGIVSELGEEEPLDEIEELNMDLAFECQPALRPDLKLDTLQFVCQLGKGQFGTVHLATNAREERFAVKVMSAAHMVENGWELMIECERNAMLELGRHPFLVSLLNFASTSKQVALVLESCEYGNLGDLLALQRRASKNGHEMLVSEDQAKFYLANIVLGLEYMHSKEIIYRDLKTENVMIGPNGYCKLADFGLAKKTRQTYTFCGTPDFMAPEILLRKGHGSAVDWWACGVLLFEMLAGETPFVGCETSDIYDRILAHTDPTQLSYPSHCVNALTAPCKDLIQSFLHPKKTKRLGVKFPGVLGIKQHAHFTNFDWDAVREQRLDAPLLPRRKDLVVAEEEGGAAAAMGSSYDAQVRREWDAQKADKIGWAAKFAQGVS